MNVIDAHVHVGIDVAHGYSLTIDELLKMMDRAEVNMSVVCPFARPGNVKEQNDFVAKQIGSNKRLLGFCTVNPREDDSTKEVQRAIQDLGLKGIMLDIDAFFMFFLGVNQPNVTRPLHDEAIFEMAYDLGVPIMFHTHQPNGGYLGRGLVGRISGIARRHQQIPMIVHRASGGMSLLKESPLLFVDTSMDHSFRGIFNIDELIRDRILFASNAPIEHPFILRKLIEKAKISERTKNCILGENMAKLLKLEF